MKTTSLIEPSLNKDASVFMVERKPFVIPIREFMLKSQASLVKERSKKLLLTADTLERRANMIIEMNSITTGEVGQVRVFTEAPNELHGVEFRGVAGELDQMDLSGMEFEIVSENLGAMNRPSVPNQDDFPADRTPNRLDEPGQILGFDIAGMRAETKLASPAFRRYSNSADARTPRVFLRLDEAGSLPAGRPSAPKNRLQHKAGFIQEDDRLFFPVLSLAEFAPGISSLPSDFVPEALAEAFDNSSSSGLKFSRHGRGETLFRIPSRLLSRRAPASSAVDSSRASALLATRVLPASCGPLASTGSVAGYAVWPLKPSAQTSVLAPATRIPYLLSRSGIISREETAGLKPGEDSF